MKLLIWVFAAQFFISFSVFSQDNSVEEGKKESTDNSVIIKRTAKNTVTPVLLNHGDVLEFTLKNGQKRTIKLLETNASVMRTNVQDMDIEQSDGGTIAEFTCKILVDGHVMTMQRYLPTQESFYEPYVINGMRIWFDAVQDYFDIFTLKHGWAKPRADARLAVSDANDPVAPEIAMWYPNDLLFIDVRDSYLGDDVWMGPYLGGSPHAGLDINTPLGTPLFAPIPFKEKGDQWLEVDFEPKPYYWAATMTGKKEWSNGSVWTLKTLHLDKYLVEEHTPLEIGTQFAEAAGTGVGAEEHSHFEFMIQDDSTNTVDGFVMVKGNILTEKDSSYIIDVDGVKGAVPKSSALYIRREDRPKNSSIFMIAKEIAYKNDFPFEIPQIPMDPWLLFWQMFENEKNKQGLINAQIASFEPVKVGEAALFLSEGSRTNSLNKHLNYHWTFGDGGYSNEKNPEYTYSAPGIYPVSLVVDDGSSRDRFTQHITVDGDKKNFPSLTLDAPTEPAFHLRDAAVMDIYGEDIKFIPHTLHFVARQSNPYPEAKEIMLVNKGGGELSEAVIDLTFMKGKDWVKVVKKNEGNKQKLLVRIDAENLAPETYFAIVKVKSSEAFNPVQLFQISLVVKPDYPNYTVTIDDNDPGFFATPYFWVGSKFHRWTAGYKDFYLTNGGRAKEGEYFKFTPDLRKGKYKVYFTSETPFRNGKFKVLVHSAEGDKFLWMEPKQSRIIGEFNFSEGMDGFVQVFADGSEGEIIADAVKFERIGR